MLILVVDVVAVDELFYSNPNKKNQHCLKWLSMKPHCHQLKYLKLKAVVVVARHHDMAMMRRSY